MWELYDKLIGAIPENIYADEVICGKTWTAVRSSEGSIGLAMTTPVETLPRSGEGAVGMSLRAVAEKVKSWNFIEAGIGMAAINAFYNSPQRMRSYKTEQGDSRFCTYELPIEGRKICMIGALRYPPELFESAERLVVLERNLVDGTYPDSACEYFVPDSDLVLITGSAFINKTMPRLLELGKNADVIITGPSAPMSFELLEYGVRRVAGLVITDNKACLDFVASGEFGTPYRFGERYIVE